MWEAIQAAKAAERDRPVEARSSSGRDLEAVERELRRARRAVRARHRGVAPVAVVGKVGLAALVTARTAQSAAGSAGRAPSRRSWRRRESLQEGSPRWCSSDHPRRSTRTSGTASSAVPIACQSEGALEIYVEPVFPAAAPGRDRTLARRRRAGRAWPPRSDGATVVVDDGGSATNHPGVETVFTSLDLGAAGVGERSFVVVATQGHYDEDALEQALATPPHTWAWSPPASGPRACWRTSATEA